MNKKFFKLLAVTIFLLNNFEIFSKEERNDGTRKRKNLSLNDRFNKNGNYGSDFLAYQIIANNHHSLGDQVNISELSKKRSFSTGDREREIIKKSEEKFNKYYNQKTDLAKRHLNIIEECLNNLENFEFDGNDIENIRKKISVEVNIIKKLDSEVEKSIKENYNFKVRNKRLGDLIEKIKLIKTENFKEITYNSLKIVEEIQEKLNLAENFVKSVKALNEISGDISVTDTKKSLDFLDKFAEFNSYFIKIQNTHLKNSTFYKNISIDNLLTYEEKEQYKKFKPLKNNGKSPLNSLVSFKYRSIINKFNNFFSNKTKELNDKLNNFNEDIENENKEIGNIFNKNGLKFDEAEDYANNNIKEKFKNKDDSDKIEDFSKKINTKKKEYSDKINIFNNSYSEISKQFEDLEKIKEKILSTNIKFKKDILISNSKIKNECFENVNIKLEQIKKTDETLKENCKKYSKLAGETKKLIEQFKENNQQDYDSRVNIDLANPDVKIQETLNTIYARVKLSKEESLILSKEEFKTLNGIIKDERDQVKNYLDENLKKLNTYNNSITNLDIKIKRKEKELKDKIDTYNNLLKKKKENNDIYLSKIREANENIINKVKEIENGECKERISKMIIKNFYTHFRFKNQDITPNNIDSIDKFKSSGIKLFIAKLPEEFKKITKFEDHVNDEITSNKELNDFINKISAEIDELNNKNDDFCKDIEIVKKVKENLKLELKNLEKDKQNLENQISTLNTFFENNKQILEVYVDDEDKDDKTVCDEYNKIVKDITETSNKLKNVKFDNIKKEDTEDEVSKDLDNDENDLKHRKYKVKQYNARVLKEYNDDESNLYEVYKTIYNVDKVEGKTLDNENIEFSKIKARCEYIRNELIKKFIEDLKKFAAIAIKSENSDIIKLNDIYNLVIGKHNEYIQKNKYVTSFSLYFLEYFYYKEQYSKIENEINNIYNLLLKYKALLDINLDVKKSNTNFDINLDVKKSNTNFKNSLEVLNVIFNKYFDNLFQFESGKFKLNKKFKKSTYFDRILGKEIFLKQFNKLCKFYTIEGDSKNCINDILKKIYEIKGLDEYLNKGDIFGKTEDIIKEITNIYDNITAIKKNFIDFKNYNISHLNEQNKNTNKFDIILGNNPFCSDLKILNKYIGKIISEFTFFKENDKDKDENIFNKDTIEFKSLKFEDENKINNIYYILQTATYYDRIFDENDGFSQSLIDSISKILDKLYSHKIYQLIENFDKVFNPGTRKISFLNLENITEKDLNEIIDKFYKDKDENSVFYKEGNYLISKLIFCDQKLLGLVDEINKKEFKIPENLEKSFENLEKNLKEDYKYEYNGEIDNFVEAINNIWNLQKELYNILGYLNKLYKGYSNFSDMKKIKFEKKVKAFKFTYNIENNKYFSYECEPIDNPEINLKDLLNSVDKFLYEEIYGKLKMLSKSMKIAENIDAYQFMKDIKNFFDEFKEPKDDPYNNLDPYDEILKFAKKEMKELLNGGQYEGIKNLLKHKGKFKDNTEFYFNYKLREKFAGKFIEFFSKINNYIKNNFFEYNIEINGPNVSIGLDNVKNDIKTAINDAIEEAKKEGKEVDAKEYNLPNYKMYFNFIINHIDFFGSFFKFFDSITELLTALEFIKLDKGNYVEIDTKFSYSEVLTKYINNFKELYKLKDWSDICKIGIMDKNYNINEEKLIPSIYDMLKAFADLICEEFHVDEGALKKEILNYISDLNNADFKQFSNNAEDNNLKLLSLLNSDKSIYNNLTDIFINKVTDDKGKTVVKKEILKYDLNNILVNYGFTPITNSNYYKEILKKVFDNLKGIFLLVDEKDDVYSLNKLVILLKHILTTINNFSTNTDKEMPIDVKGNFYDYINECLTIIKNAIDNHALNPENEIKKTFWHLENVEEYGEDILSLNSKPVLQIFKDKNGNEYYKKEFLYLHKHLDLIFSRPKVNMKTAIQLFSNNLFFFQAYYDNNIENTLGALDAHPLNNYDAEIRDSLKNDIDDFYNKISDELFNNDGNNKNIFKLLISKLITFDPNITGESFYDKLFKVYEKISETYYSSNYHTEPNNNADVVENRKIIAKLNNIYNNSVKIKDINFK